MRYGNRTDIHHLELVIPGHLACTIDSQLYYLALILCHRYALGLSDPSKHTALACTEAVSSKFQTVAYIQIARAHLFRYYQYHVLVDEDLGHKNLLALKFLGLFIAAYAPFDVDHSISEDSIDPVLSPSLHLLLL
jgi:hypothetical protein